MDCNRDEALRAKTIAEDKIRKKDFSGAKKFALKAKSLYPNLDGVTQMLTTVDVYISAENKISGEIDWYAVLSLSPSADDEALRKQYRKLALMLHPDKNKSIGADDAFKLVSEAWSLLSDKSKRLAYNQRRGHIGGPQQKVHMHTTSGPPAPPSQANGSFNFSTKMTTPIPKTQSNVTKPKPKPKPPIATPSPNNQSHTFWTTCLRCKMHYEYLKMYLNQTLLCTNCHEPFMATETAPPANFPISSSNQLPPRPQQHQSATSNNNPAPPSRNAYNPVRKPPVAQKMGPGSDPYRFSHGKANVATTDPSIAAKAATVVQQVQNKMKRAYNESQHASAGMDGYLNSDIKKAKLDDNNSSSRFGMNYNNNNNNNSSALGSRIYGFPNFNRRPNSGQDLSMVKTHAMLTAKAHQEIRNMLRRSETDSEKPVANKVNKENVPDQNGNDKEGPTDESMSVPDSDFHDFDKDRSESSFGDNEVWAAYDDDDGMPRFYALISKVISKRPFKLKISWLNSRTTGEFGNMDWVGSGFYKTCGEFWVGRYEMCKSINSFSQKVNFSKGPRGSIFIFPQKGDVWAIYINWSSDWNEHTPDEVIRKYDMVVVLDNYSEGKGVSVAPLVKVAGFKTIFRQNVGPEAVRRIPKEEMFRFSHRVPNKLLTGLEGSNAPKGCLELDPAATSLELLQVIT
ncbi:hypothetical protein CASFOL_003291 [Castilleja foliolosa]|uniref:J domain-containing protein n=1 Tax=Castilleja foliolosa TaxID=1961234 RepID=A0ABD3EGQ8_9LAMI